MTAQQQAEEGLRRARGDQPTNTCTALLLQAAAHLRADRPTQDMHEAVRVYLARRLASDRYRDDRALADEARTQFLRRAPVVLAGQTRGEYALLLDRAAAEAV
ncbi:hypothetical protein [Streptomyces racemochromogenes]|uniref:hypothetical protein n=1 Tax=Streptomyces racemochromogenes TaxID=67353 RepID=UPI0031E74A79